MPRDHRRRKGALWPRDSRRRRGEDEVKVPTQARGHGPARLRPPSSAQAELGGPVVVKIAAAIHKSDVGGVAVGIGRPQAAAEAVTAIHATLTDAGIAEHAAEFLVQEQIRDGVEMIVGVSYDPAFGPWCWPVLAGPQWRSSATWRSASPLSATPTSTKCSARCALTGCSRLPPVPAAGRGGLCRVAAPGQRHGRGRSRDRRTRPQPGIRPPARRRRRRRPHSPHRMTSHRTPAAGQDRGVLVHTRRLKAGTPQRRLIPTRSGWSERAGSFAG